MLQSSNWRTTKANNDYLIAAWRSGRWYSPCFGSMFVASTLIKELIHWLPAFRYDARRNPWEARMKCENAVRPFLTSLHVLEVIRKARFKGNAGAACKHPSRCRQKSSAVCLEATTYPLGVKAGRGRFLCEIVLVCVCQCESPFLSLDRGRKGGCLQQLPPKKGKKKSTKRTAVSLLCAGSSGWSLHHVPSWSHSLMVH